MRRSCPTLYSQSPHTAPIPCDGHLLKCGTCGTAGCDRPACTNCNFDVFGRCARCGGTGADF